MDEESRVRSAQHRVHVVMGGTKGVSNKIDI